MAKVQGALEVMATAEAERVSWCGSEGQCSGVGQGLCAGVRGDGPRVFAGQGSFSGCLPLSLLLWLSVSPALSYCPGRTCNMLLATGVILLGLFCVLPVDLGASSWPGMCLLLPS